MSTGKDTILQGRIFSPLIKFTVPLMLALLLQALYGAVDLIVVGKFGSTSSVSAVSNGSQIMQTVTDIITGLSMGVTVLVGRFVGSGDREKAADVVAGMVKLFLIAALVLSTVMIIMAHQIAQLMQVPPEAMAQTVVYIRVCSAGMIFITAFNVISGLFRGLGNSKSPLLFITIACSVNIVGDLLLCGVLKMDAAGAAVATVFAQAVSVAFSVTKIRNGSLPFKISRRNFKTSKGMPRRIIKIGGPLALQNCLVSISFLIIMAIINTKGLVASASVGIAEKLFVFLALVPLSFMYGLSAFVAQNVGAKQELRAIKAMKYAMLTSFFFGVMITTFTYFFGNIAAGFFTDSLVVIAAAHEYLRGTSGEYSVLPFVFCFLGYFNGIGKTQFVLISGLVSSFLVRIPLCYYLSRLPESSLFIIGLSVPISSVSTFLMCTVYYIFVRKQRLAMHRL
ncbi:MAG: MATE family efflux transporter [Oscillospiraceae bacterium]|nr:MATE family efflux transporter [Oscillospiraceae bacterium]